MVFGQNSQKYAKTIAENARKEIDSLEIELKHLKIDLILIWIGGNFTTLSLLVFP